ncbi:MAG: class I SAM-dependent methyltransferase [archaeon]|nr:MAG: class I SAM-dependent methyltransferase [archaeon]
MPKDRGIEKVKDYFEDFLDLVRKKIASQGRVRILDAGCGYGIAMLGFVKEFGNKVEMIGFNYSEKDGSREMMKKEAVKKRIFSKKELSKIKLPRIIYCDASKKLPFKSNYFDFVYSMASIYLYDDKINFLQECNRVLKKKGIARLSVAFWPHFKNKVGFPSKYYEMWEIWDKGKEIKIIDYFKKFKNIRNIGKAGDRLQYLEIKKVKKLDFGLKLVTSIDYNFIWKKWAGIKSIYTTQRKLKPRWK